MTLSTATVIACIHTCTPYVYEERKEDRIPSVGTGFFFGSFFSLAKDLASQLTIGFGLCDATPLVRIQRTGRDMSFDFFWSVCTSYTSYLRRIRPTPLHGKSTFHWKAGEQSLAVLARLASFLFFFCLLLLPRTVVVVVLLHGTHACSGESNQCGIVLLQTLNDVIILVDSCL